MLDEHGDRIRLPSGEWKSYKTKTTDWDNHGKAEIWRTAWAETLNRYLEKNERRERIDLRSYARQGKETAPTVHLGPAVAHMEQKGIRTEIGDSREKQFCSDKCRLQWWHEHRDSSKRAAKHICPECNRVFSTDRTQKYCSHECYILARFGRKRINEAGSGAV